MNYFLILEYEYVIVGIYIYNVKDNQKLKNNKVIKHDVHI